MNDVWVWNYEIKEFEKLIDGDDIFAPPFELRFCDSQDAKEKEFMDDLLDELKKIFGI